MNNMENTIITEIEYDSMVFFVLLENRLKQNIALKQCGTKLEQLLEL